jgi:TPR repeat protein
MNFFKWYQQACDQGRRIPSLEDAYNAGYYQAKTEMANHSSELKKPASYKSLNTR